MKNNINPKISFASKGDKIWSERNLSSVRYDIGYRPIRFYLKQHCYPNKQAQIILSVSVQGTRMRVFTKMKVEPVFWERSEQRCYDSELLCTRVRNRVQKINMNLERIVTEVEHQDRLLAERGKFLTMESLRRSIGRVISPANAPRHNNPLIVLRHLAETYTEHLNERGQKGTQSSSQTYLMALSRLERFVAETGYVLRDFSCLDKVFYERFKEYLVRYQFKRGGKMMKYTSNTVLNTISVINNLAHKAYELNLSGEQYFKASCSIRHERAVKIYLTEKELSRLEKVNVLTPSEEKIRDMFLIASYTALRISDINGLNKATFRSDSMTLQQKKTGNAVSIPILKEISGIVEKYRVGGFPVLNPSLANVCIKELVKRAGIDDIIMIPEIRGGVKEFKQVPKYTQVSFHTARRSCITNLFKRGYSTNYLMSLSGHKSLASFQQYIKSDASEMSKEFIRELKRKKDI